MKRVLPIVAALLLVAVPGSAQAPVPPAGTTILYVAISDGATILPVTSGVLPLRCEAVAQ